MPQQPPQNSTPGLEERIRSGWNFVNFVASAFAAQADFLLHHGFGIGYPGGSAKLGLMLAPFAWAVLLSAFSQGEAHRYLGAADFEPLARMIYPNVALMLVHGIRSRLPGNLERSFYTGRSWLWPGEDERRVKGVKEPAFLAAASAAALPLIGLPLASYLWATALAQAYTVAMDGARVRALARSRRDAMADVEEMNDLYRRQGGRR